MEFRLLGGVEAFHDGAPVDLGPVYRAGRHADALGQYRELGAAPSEAATAERLRGLGSSG
ncbi:hypothetical protein [Umezawaea tangerina]|uniref:Uncharacterized protein n=1 Tax=Umezawaea tangerina TaxID=84725 RepID=A0A2T0T994_9PSEU|nr:hypothetical protein [Umezawaea tangerina]PRY42243.1 hypothetical protein CLV43_10473 [Umezawaea tangerina]